MGDIDFERPLKKRRFFVEEPDQQDRPSSSPPPRAPSVVPEEVQDAREDAEKHDEASDQSVTLDRSTLESFIGESLSIEVVKRLQDLSSGNIERAINIYLDGSYKETVAGPTPSLPNRNKTSAPPTPQASHIGDTHALQRRETHESMPETRYIGAFGAVCWATRSGTNLIKSGETVQIERTKSQSFAKMGPGRKLKVPMLNKRQDTIVRFTNTRGEEVGRLETETSTWVSSLLDQKICILEGSCVYAPDRVRSNDTIYLQLRCYLLKSGFDSRGLIKPQDNNRQTGRFEVKETQDERDLHQRQLALIKLFNEINLNPSKSNASTERHKRQGLLKAAEAAEQSEQNDNNGTSTAAEAGVSSPPSDDAEEGTELEEDQLDTLYKKAQTFDFNTPEDDPASTFRMELRKYQKQALHWMMGKEMQTKPDQEMSMHPLWEEYTWPLKDVDDADLPAVEGVESFYVNPYSGELSLDFPVQEQNCLGGVLADEMGLGKTIEMLSLMHTHRSREAQEVQAAQSAETTDVNSLPRLPRSSSQIGWAPCTTLVVAPMSLLAQWQSEAEKASQTGSLKVLVYYGAERDRGINLKNLCCEANAAGAPNLIITSYGTILSEYTQIASSGGERGSHGGLLSLEYFRVILDEAHHIKNRQSKTAKACYEIHARHRWVLTGTPIVNRLEDLFSLVHFLRVEPWANFSFWKTFITQPFDNGDYVKALDVVQTVLEPLVLRRTKDMKTPDGEALVPLPPRTINVEKIHLTQMERDVYDLMFHRAKRTFSANVEAGTLMKSYTTIFAQILRLRQSCCHPTLVRNKNVVADEEDAAAAADIANGLADDMDLQALIERFTAEGEGSEQDVNRFGAHALQSIQDEAEHECPICAEEPMIEQSVTGCWHSACKKCLVDYINHQKEKGELPRCFNCREPVNTRDVFEVVRSDDDVSASPDRSSPHSVPPTTPQVTLRRIGSCSTSAKIATLMTHLKKIRRQDRSAKSVVFSQFTSFLDLLEPALTEAHISFLRFDGSMAQKQRAAVLESFADMPVDPTAPTTKSKASSKAGTVLLLSLRAGGVGLNLTAASRVFVMDPWWSWAVEAQAIDRVHRMGQTREVEVTRFVCEDSIEEKMLRIQERKRFIASSLGMMSEEEKRANRIEDIRELLS